MTHHHDLASPSALDGLAVVVVAAGSGTRLGYGMPKALVPVAGRPLLEHAKAQVDANDGDLQAFLGERLQALRARASVPVVAGFGIKDADSAAAMARQADGVVVGSALVQAMAGAGTPEAAAQLAGDFLRPIRAALDAVPA